MGKTVYLSDDEFVLLILSCIIGRMEDGELSVGGEDTDPVFLSLCRKFSTPQIDKEDVNHE